MSTNPQWRTFQPPAIGSDTAIIDFKTMIPNAHSPAGGNSGGGVNSFRFATNGSNNAQKGFSSTVPYATKSSPGSGQFSNVNYVSGNTGGNSGSSRNGRFPIGTFTASENSQAGASTYNGESPSAQSNSSSYGDAALGAQGLRETGIIEKLLHSYGFIQCCERQARLFFHFSQFNGNIEHLKIGDPVEFEMTYDRRTGKPIASAVTKIAPEVVLSEERVTGTVTTELRSEGAGGDLQGRISYENRGECFFLPYGKDDVEGGGVNLLAGDRVSFQIATNQRSGNLGARHVRLENAAHPVRYQGVVCSMKDNFGFIERADVVREIFFHFSETKGIRDELRLGDDVEFTIQSRNGKEVACSISRLPAGTVIFEDVGEEIIKGQVLKPIERGGGNNSGQGGGQQQRHQQADPLPGRIRYRNSEHVETEIPFGDKDQKGDFTLRHGDWVEFRIATDRRDGLRRATSINLLEESFTVSGERREVGVVTTLKDGFGFLRCLGPAAQSSTASQEKGAQNSPSQQHQSHPRCFFHFSEILDVDREISVGDEVEFTPVQDSGMPNRQSAIRIKHLPPGTINYSGDNHQHNIHTGIVVKECAGWGQKSPTKNQGNGDKQENGLISYTLNGMKKTVPFYPKECDSKNVPHVGDKVEFVLSRRGKDSVALEVQVILKGGSVMNGVCNNGQVPGTICQGFVAALKDGFGFIEASSHDREVFFHFSNFDGDTNNLELGLEVEYTLAPSRNNSGTCMSAENVTPLPKGTVPVAAAVEPPPGEDPYSGVVARPLRSVNPEQSEYAGLVRRFKRGPKKTAAEKAKKKEDMEKSWRSRSDSTSGYGSSSTEKEDAEKSEGADKEGANGEVDSKGDCEDVESMEKHEDDDLDDVDDDMLEDEEEDGGGTKEGGKHSAGVYEFGIMGLANKRDLLQAGDPVRFRIDADGRATEIEALRKKITATVDAVKGLFGFLAYEVEKGKKLFFHMSEVSEGTVLSPGDQVVFELVTNRRTGKSSACKVTKISDSQRPERLISKLRGLSVDECGPKLTVVRQPRGPDGTRGFSEANRAAREQAQHSSMQEQDVGTVAAEE
ncbi:cold shock domain-containing protein E1 [Ischnura elegans]|uniref:cold shock domain-containing protein E1 n=1 Tax=Ischnura elegans TaxID=197161 RepID=UPI001ED89C11|nr:cold shock domain-containing protein E1 [Ischnura elegans]XP_046389894.1 cold shock domain-containing protein E1 [Ischnura elegans]